MKKILVIGGTGAMGVYLVPELVKLGYQVDVVALDHPNTPEGTNPRYLQANAADDGYLAKLLENRYDGIVDFLVYNTQRFRERHRLFLENTDHYIFLSTYRVYANEDYTITEQSPRLLDVTTDPALIASDDYCMTKARQEEILRASGYQNWTIIRPSITYSKMRFQLVIWEANVLLDRAFRNKPLVLPEAAMDKETTMTWAGNVGVMIARLLFNEKAYGEAFTPATSEHHTWRYVAECYRELVGLRWVEADTESFLRIRSGGDPTVYGIVKWQLEYDRLFDRRVDNRKILAATGLRQEDLMPLKEGLALELSRFPKDHVWDPRETLTIFPSMERYLEENGIR